MNLPTDNQLNINQLQNNLQNYRTIYRKTTKQAASPLSVQLTDQLITVYKQVQTNAIR